MKLKLLGRPLSASILYQNGYHISGAELVAKSARLATRLLECSTVINLAEDRLDFIIGFLAALIAKKTTLLPANTKAATLQAMADEYPQALLLVSTPQPISIPQQLIQNDDIMTCLYPPEKDYWVDAEFKAITVYTSGSTGHPKANSKTWQALVRTAEKLFQRFEQLGALKSGSYLMGTVPSQHMYGLEMLVMLPLANPVIGLVERGLLPEYLSNTAQSAPQPVVLISSPIHVQALVEQKVNWSGFAGVVSATAPLERQIAIEIEQRHLGVWEIYGCTEAGSLATRRTIETAAWQFLPGIIPVMDDVSCAVDIDHLGARIALQDQINLHSDGSFELGERNSDLIKIGGKRGSLAQITGYIKQHPAISDAYVFASNSKFTRLYAMVCGQVSGYEIKRFLATKIDDVFVPRIVRHVANLPRNTNGKIIQGDILALWHTLANQPALNSSADFNSAAKSALSYTKADGQVQRRVQIPVVHAVFEAHFPVQPLVPAALILTWIQDWLVETKLNITAVKSCKFLHPILPGETLILEHRQLKPGRIALKLVRAEIVVLDGQFEVEMHHVE